jgi:hypothetical protein
MNNRRTPPRNKPAPFRSPLWAHKDLIEGLRCTRATWQEISDILRRDFSLSVHPTAICNWCNRNRARSRPLPYGIRPEPVSKPKVKVVNVKKPEASREPLQIIE